ncbi:MAG: hypothetical protein ACP6IQ_11115 [Candidatus Njordarchaeia archaeon]
MKEELRDLPEFITTVFEPCGCFDEIIALYKPKFTSLVFERIRKKVNVKRYIEDLLLKGYYKDFEVTIYSDGKIIVSGVKDKKEGIKILKELLA